MRNTESMKNKKSVVIAAIVVAVVIVWIARYNSSVKSHRSAVVCGNIPDAPCYLYTCVTGDVEQSIGGNASCSDGSEVIRGNEAPRMAK
jgi:hypothetical protein